MWSVNERCLREMAFQITVVHSEIHVAGLSNGLEPLCGCKMTAAVRTTQLVAGKKTYCWREKHHPRFCCVHDPFSPALSARPWYWPSLTWNEGQIGEVVVKDEATFTASPGGNTSCIQGRYKL